MGTIQILILAPHIAAGFLATAAGGVALAARKGSALHARAGAVFVPAMLAMYGLGLLYVPVDPTPDPILAVAAAIGAYLVLTAREAARRRDGRAGRFERAAFAVVLACLAASVAFLMLALGSPDGRFYGHGPATMAPNLLVASLAAAFDLAFILRGRLKPNQRLARHVWRIGVAMLMVTFATFAGDQVQKAMPDSIRGSFLLTLPALAVVAAIVFWLLRLRFARSWRRGPAQNPDRKAATLAPSRSTA
jgi:hypothetical protein